MAIYIETGRANSREYKVLYEGCVLATRERNWYDDSDFYAICWDEKLGRIVEYEYATTRAWTYNNGAKVDATPEAIAKAKQWRFLQTLKSLAALTVQDAQTPDIGKRVRVVGLGKNHGKEGEIFWKQERRSQYGTWHYGWRYGITLDGVKEYGNRGRYTNVIWTEAQLEVIDWEQYVPAAEEIEDRARSYAEHAYCAPIRSFPGMTVI